MIPSSNRPLPIISQVPGSGVRVTLGPVTNDADGVAGVAGVLVELPFDVVELPFGVVVAGVPDRGTPGRFTALPTDPAILRSPSGSDSEPGEPDDTKPGALEALEPEFELLAGRAGVAGSGVDVEGELADPEAAPGREDFEAGFDAGPTGDVPIAGRALLDFVEELVVPGDEPASLEP